MAAVRSYLARKKFFLRGKISYLRGKNTIVLAKKEERTHCLRALSSSLYKYTTFSREIQIALTSRNTPRNIKMQRFAADGGCHVLYYEARLAGCHCLSAMGGGRLVGDTDGFRDRTRN